MTQKVLQENLLSIDTILQNHNQIVTIRAISSITFKKLTLLILQNKIVEIITQIAQPWKLIPQCQGFSISIGLDK